MTENRVGYMAALIDGEGTICLSRAKRNNLWVYSPGVFITNTNIKLVEHCLITTKLGAILPHNQATSKAKASYIWKLKLDEITPFLSMIQSSLIIKWEQAELMLEYCKFYRGIQGGNIASVVTEEFHSIRRIIYEELRELNKRGPDV